MYMRLTQREKEMADMFEQSSISERTYIYIFRHTRRCQDNKENI